MVPAPQASKSGHMEGVQKDTPYKGKSARITTRWDRLKLGAMGLVSLSLVFAVFDEAFDHNWSSPAPQGKPFHIEVKGGAILPKSAGPEWAWLQQHLVKVEGALEVEMERMEQRLEEAELRIAAHEHALTESLEEGLTARKMLTGGSGGMSMGMSLGVRRGFGVKRFRGKVSKGTKCDSMSCEVRKIAQYQEPLTPPDEALTEFPQLVVLGGVPAVEIDASSRIYFLEALPDRCAGVAHKRYSLTCAAAEAKALGRQLAVHMTTCLSANHTGRKLNQWVPTAAYFDLEGIARNQGMPLVYVEQLVSALEHAELLSSAETGPGGREGEGEGEGEGVNGGGQAGAGAGAGAGGTGESGGKGWKKGEGLVRIFSRRAASRELERAEGSTPVVVRHLGVSENGFDACHASANKHLLPLDPGSIPFNPHLTRIAESIVAELGGRTNFTAVHIRRGDKAKDHKQWPNLDRDTSPDRLKETLPRFAPPGSALYLATNEAAPHFFDPLKEAYSVFLMDDFKHLWGPGSAWLASYQELFNSPEPELDVYMRGIVDDHIVWLAQQRVETFNDLTADPRNGVLEDKPKG